MSENEVRSREAAETPEPWQSGAAQEDAEEARELSAMSEAELEAEMQEELGPVGRWMQDHAAAAEFANALYPDLLDIDEAQQALPETNEVPRQ
jgi:hypothetical protein